MGYQPRPKNYELEFVDHPGLEVTVQSTSLGRLLDVQEMKLQLNEADPAKRMEIFEFFADCLVSWNIDHPDIPRTKPGAQCPRCTLLAGDPLPADVTGMMCLELDFIMTIIFGWVVAIARVSDPKGMSLNNGESLTQTLMNQLANLANPGISPEQK